MNYQRPLFYKLLTRMQEPRKFIQVLTGPRQIGKTTMAVSLQKELDGLVEYYSADDTAAYGTFWIDRIWESLRLRLNQESLNEAVLIIDEIQKISDWSSAVKKHWDSDSRNGVQIKLLLLGSSRLLLMDGLSESLLGRYETIYAGHWALAEMEKAFGFSVEEYIWFGGYPGAAHLINEEERFKEYIRNSIVEPTLVRDILMTTKIDKPALLRQLFDVGVGHSTQIVSYNKMLGQLQDAGNTTTLAKYLRLLEQSGLLCGLNKYSGKKMIAKGTIPKFQVHNTALLSALSRKTIKESILDPIGWGHAVENSVGAYLVEQVKKNTNTSLYYWREEDVEIDYIILIGEQIVGVEVKSGEAGIPERAAERFLRRFPDSKLALVGKNGIPLEVFLNTELSELAGAATLF